MVNTMDGFEIAEVDLKLRDLVILKVHSKAEYHLILKLLTWHAMDR